MANRFPLIFNSGAGQIQELAASDNLDLTSSNLVNAGILFTSSGSVTAPSLQIGSGTTYNPGLYSPGTDQLAVATNGTSRLSIDASGNVAVDTNTLYVDAVNNRVAIGTTSPIAGYLLDVRGSMYMAGTNSRIYVDNGGVGGSSVQIGVSGTSHGYIGTDGNFPLVFQPNNTERARIRADGTFEIKGAGTAGTSPGFSVNPSTPANSFVIDSSGRLGIATSSPAVEFQVNAASDVTIALSNSSSVTSGNRGGISMFNSAVSTVGNIRFVAVTDNVGTEIQFYTRPAAGSLTQTMTLDSAGRLGLGISPSNWSGYKVLQAGIASFVGASSGAYILSDNCYTDDAGVSWKYISSSYAAAQYYAAAGAHVWRTASSGTANNVVSFTQALTLDTSGRLLVGTPTSLNSNALLQVYKASGGLISIVDSDSLSDGESASFRVSGGTAIGELGAYKHSGIASPCIFLDIQAQDGASNYYWTDNSDIFRTSTNAANIGTTGGTVVGTQSSDERIKDILGPVEYGLDILKQIEPVRYTLKTEPDTEKLGFIAQQVQPLVPQSVFDTKEYIEGEPEDAPTKLGMEYVALLPVLVNAIKELSAKNDALEARLAALESA